MNTRKLLGLLAALVIAIGVAGSATAQQDDSQAVSVELIDTAAEGCGISISVYSGTFGTWEYDAGSATYFNTDTGGSTIRFRASVDVRIAQGCDLTISFDGLANGANTIDTSHFTAYSYFTGASVNPASFTTTRVGASSPGVKTNDFQYTLNSVSNLPPGTYTGNIEALVSSAV